MADQCDLCLLGLIILSSLLTGTIGAEVTDVFISSGENVRLPCNNALSDCNSSTTWIYYNSIRHSGAVELITKGIKKKDTERHERLSLGSDCSLNIKNVTEEDSGSYTCQQWTGPNSDQQHGPDARVSLHVRHAEVTATAVIPVHITNSARNTPETTGQDRSTTNSQVTKVAVISVAAVAVFLLAVLWLIYRKTAGNKRETVDSAVKDENEQIGTYETINMSIPPAARANVRQLNEQTDDHVTYSEVTSSNKKPVKSVEDHNDTVTYAAIR